MNQRLGVNFHSVLALSTILAASLALADGPTREVAMPSLAPLVDSVKASVVNLEVQKRVLASEQAELLERFGMRRRGGSDEVNSGTGSGFIIDPKGLVVTNNHVVEGAIAIRVRMEDGRSFDGTVLGRDPLTDVALVRLTGKFDPLPSVKLGDSSQLKQGDWVVAIGNPFGLSFSASAGIISALDRQIGASRYDQFLQTDAAINPGNSGGPLFNLKGEVVGINTAILNGGPNGASGIGFAVPSNLAKALVPQLEKSGSVTRGWLGVAIQDVNAPLAKALGLSISEGALINSVNEGSPAAKAGLKEEDVVVAIDGEKVASAAGLTRVVALKRPDTSVTMSIFRATKPLELKVHVGVRPDLEGVGELEKKSGETQETKLRVGIILQELDPRLAEQAGLPKQGALIADVSPGTPADKAGLHRGMVVVEANHKPIKSRDELMATLRDIKSGVLLLKIAVPNGGSARTLVAVEVP